MADNEAQQTAGESFSELLFTNANAGLDTDGCYDYTAAFSSENPTKMLCFGNIECSVFRPDLKKPAAAQKSHTGRTDSPKPNGRRNGPENESSVGTRAPANGKRAKSERSNLTGHGKVKKEKLGERIAALQQLVSPYGKTDTASVLHEAMGYIKFLQDQIQVLCSPYLQAWDDGDGDQVKKDLKSTGLCLIPIECISLIANNNGADFWSPAMSKNFSPN